MSVRSITTTGDDAADGVQIAGRPYEDEVVLGIAAILDHEFGYAAPPLVAKTTAGLTSSL